MSVTVPEEVAPPATEVGERLRERTCGGLIVRVAAEVVRYVPEILTLVVLETAAVVTVKVALVRPLGTVTLAGTPAAELLLCRATTTPNNGAGPLSIAVAVEELPPVKEAGLTEMLERVSGSTVSTADATPL